MNIRVIIIAMLGLLSHNSPTHCLHSIDVPKLKRFLMDIMECQSIRQTHTTVVLNGTEIFRIQLETLPNGTAVEMDPSKKMLLLIASVSKGMYATALSFIGEEIRRATNNPNFDIYTQPVKSAYGPNFWFLDHGRTEQVTIEDILSHATGLRRHDVLWYMKYAKSKQDVIKYTTRLNATLDFRASYMYNNLVWTIADLATEKWLTDANLLNVTEGKGFPIYMRKFLWHKLQMNETYSLSEMPRNTRRGMNRWKRIFKNVFTHHDKTTYDTANLQSTAANVEAAGGIVTTLNDMIKYLQFHSTWDYASYLPLPSYFEPTNAKAAQPLPYYIPDYFYPNVTDLPDYEVESYARGWIKTRYRDHLNFNHGGYLFGARCQIDLFPKLKLGMFTHINIGGGNPLDTPYSGLYGLYVNNYITDMMLKNSSFITPENKCHLLKPQAVEIGSLERRKLTQAQLDNLVGTYGQYGFGTVSVHYNTSTKLLNTQYGIHKVEIYPVQLPNRPKNQFDFYLNELTPIDNTAALSSTIVNITETHIYAYNISINNNLMYFTFIQTDSSTDLKGQALEVGIKLTKNLDPETWTRPKLCPDPNSVSKSAKTSFLAILISFIGSTLLLR